MTETLARIASPFFYEGVCTIATAAAVAIFVVRLLRRFKLVDALMALGWFALFFSFVLPWLSRVLGPDVHALLDPTNSWQAPLVASLQYYFGLPLIFFGAVLRKSRGATPLKAQQRPAQRRESAGQVTGLKDSLAEANRDLQNAREDLQKSASETDKVSSKLRETLNLLLNSEEKFRSTFERANDGFVIADIKKGLIDEANPGMAALTGYELHELAGMSLRQIYGDEIGGYDLKMFRQISGQRDLPPITIRRKDGDTIRGEISFSIIHMGGRPMLLGIARDITERVRLMEQLENKNLELKEVNVELLNRADEMRVMNEQLKDLQELKDRFISSVSHEMRTPLTSIRSFSEILLENRGAEEEVQQEFLTIINKESERLTRLINDVLDLARIEAGEMGIEMKVVSLKEVVENATRAMAPLAEQRSVAIKVMLPPDLPEVSGDADRLHQVLTNLLSNGMRFTAEGSSVEIGARVDHPGMVEVAVRDHGPGIEEGELERIFDRFRQVEGNSENMGGGTGLGLSICREIVTMHGGRIWGVSKMGRGSTFYFTVRIHAAPESEDETAEDAPAPRRELPPLKARRQTGPQAQPRRGLPPMQVGARNDRGSA